MTGDYLTKKHRQRFKNKFNTNKNNLKKMVLLIKVLGKNKYKERPRDCLILEGVGS